MPPRRWHPQTTLRAAACRHVVWCLLVVPILIAPCFHPMSSCLWRQLGVLLWWWSSGPPCHPLSSLSSLSSPSSLHPVSTPQAVAHGSSWGCCRGGGPQVLLVVPCRCCRCCRPHPHCTPFPPHEQLLVAVVGGAVMVVVLRSSLSSLVIIIVIVVVLPSSSSSCPHCRHC